MNDFHPAKSDIDLLILYHELPSGKKLSQTMQLHKAMKKEYNTLLNGFYITPDALQVHHASITKALSFQDVKIK